MHYYNYGPMHGDAWGWIGIVMLLFWLAIIIVAGIVIAKLVQHRPLISGQAEPLAIAKTRYAKGEISKTEYDQIKKDLKESR